MVMVARVERVMMRVMTGDNLEWVQSTKSIGDVLCGRGGKEYQVVKMWRRMSVVTRMM